MTNNPTIDGVSRERELFEKFTLDRADRFHPDFSRRGLHPEAEYQNPGTQGDWEIWQGRALLDAPVVELQPVGYVHQWEMERIAAGNAHWATMWDSDGANNPSRNGSPAMAVYLAPPEVSALQSNIAQLQARVQELEIGLGGMLFAFDDGVGRGWSENLLDYARKLTPAVEFDATAALNGVRK